MKLTLLFYAFLLGIVQAKPSLSQPSIRNNKAEEIQTNPDSLRIAIPEIILVENRMSISYANQNKSIQLIDPEKIKSLPAQSINELLGHVSGVDLRQRGPFGLQADVSIDGGTFEQTLILIDGVKMLDAQTAHHGLNLPLPVEAIERIEILRGPAARIYGINSLTGAINIVTKKAKQSSMNIRTFAGSNLNRDTSKNATPIFYQAGIQGSLSIVNKNYGQHNLYVQQAGGNGHRYNTANRQTQIMYTGAVRTGNKGELNWMAGYVNHLFGANGFYAAPGDKEAEELVKTSFISIGYQYKATNNLSITPRVSWRQTKDDYRYFRHDLTRARSQHTGYSISPELHAVWQLPGSAIGLGIEMRNEVIESSNIGNHQRNNLGMYAEYRKAWDEFSMNLGSYFNYHSDYGWQVFPGIDLGWSLLPNFKWTLHSGMSQRIPSFTDLYLDQRPGNIGNPSILPEEAWQIESGFKYTGKKTIAQAHYFHRNIDQFIDWVYEKGTNPPYQPLNFDQNTVKGWSVSVDQWIHELNSTGKWRLGAQYTFLSPSYQMDGSGKYQSKYSTETLKQQLTGQVTYQFGNTLFTTTARFQERLTYKKYALVDLRLTQKIKAIEASVFVQNLLNTQYIEAAAVPMPGRWISLSLNYEVPLGF